MQVSLNLTPALAANLLPAVDAEVMRGDGREPADVIDSGAAATGSRTSHPERSGVEWSSLAQQRVDALVRLATNDGTPISGSVVERIADTAALRAMIHDAESNPINVSVKHRHFTTRQKRVIKERDRSCVDCGGSEFLEYDHVPDHDITQRTLDEEGQCRCGRCHRSRHRRDAT